MLAENPDIVCLDTAYPDFVNLLCEQLFLQNYEGQIISCTLDFYGRIIEKTSKKFLEGLVFQFPDFDDAAMNEPHINFDNPNEFFTNYNERFPDAWSAVTWEYPAIAEMWRLAAEKAGSVEPMAVFAALKEGGRGPHVFGDAAWWGSELYGIDNALVGNWPVVQIQDGKATIVDYRNILDWFSKHGDLLIKQYRGARLTLEPAVSTNVIKRRVRRQHGPPPGESGLCGPGFSIVRFISRQAATPSDPAR